MELCPVPAAGFIAGAGEVAIRQQHGITLLVRMDGRRVGRHYVGAIDEPGDAPEALGLALRDEAVLRRVEALELSVLLRHDAAHRFESASLRHVEYREPLLRHLVTGAAPVHGDRNQLDLVAVEDEVARRQPFDREPGAHDRVVVLDVDIEVDRLHPEGGWRVVLEVNRLGLWFAHPVILRCTRARRALARCANRRHKPDLPGKIVWHATCEVRACGCLSSTSRLSARRPFVTRCASPAMQSPLSSPLRSRFSGPSKSCGPTSSSSIPIRRAATCSSTWW